MSLKLTDALLSICTCLHLLHIFLVLTGFVFQSRRNPDTKLEENPGLHSKHVRIQEDTKVIKLAYNVTIAKSQKLL